MHPAGRPGGAEAVAIGVARGGHDRACATAADHPGGPDIRGVQRLSARGTRSGAEVHCPPPANHSPVPAEVCPAGASDLGKISQEDVTRYIERHARDWSPGSGKAMCWSLRAFLRYLHHRGLNPLALAGCVPSIRRWKLQPADLSVRRAGPEGPRWLRSNDGVGAAGLRHPDDAGEARLAG